MPALAPTPARLPGASPAPESGVAIRIEGLTKRFPVRRTLREVARAPLARPRTTVVRDLSCRVATGECFGLLGPNGAGKSTLFKMLATLVIPDEGSATVAGHDLRTEPAAVRRALTPVGTDERSLYWRLSARENLRLFARLHRVPAREVDRRVERLLETVGLPDTGERLVAGFSSGMRQRLLLARALLARPRVLLLDEPTRSLDPLSARAFRAFLREEIIGPERCTVVLATHSTEEAMELCGRIGVLHRGSLLAVGSAGELHREFCGERYRIETRDPAHPALLHLAGRGALRVLRTTEPDAGGWSRLEVSLGGGAREAAGVLRRLVEAGVSVSRFERLDASLAELIERIIARREEEGSHG